MSWATHLKSLVLEEDHTPPVKVTLVPTPTLVFTGGAALVGATLPQDPFPARDDGFLVRLNQKITTPGTPADKFEKTMTSLTAIPDDDLRLTSTLSVLKDTAGIDKQALLADYDCRHQALDREVAEFTAVITGQRKEELDARQARLAEIEGQIQQLSIQRQGLAKAIAESKDRLDRSQAGFDNAVAALRTRTGQAIARLKGGVA